MTAALRPPTCWTSSSGWRAGDSPATTTAGPANPAESTDGQWRSAAALANPCPASTPVDFATWLPLDKTVAHCQTCRAYTLSTTSGMVPHEPKDAT